MAKVTDLNVILEMAASLVEDKCPDLVAIIGRDAASICLVAIYTTNDVCKGYGQDFTPYATLNSVVEMERVSVISFANGVSVIYDGHASRYQDRFTLCGYESLEDDLTMIAIAIQAAFDRINSRV